MFLTQASCDGHVVCMPPRRGSLKRGFYSSSTCLRRFSDPSHTAKATCVRAPGQPVRVMSMPQRAVAQTKALLDSGVLAMTGYHPDFAWLARIGVHGELDAHRRFAVPLSFDLGAGANVAISEDGQVTVQSSSGTQTFRLTLTRFANPVVTQVIAAFSVMTHFEGFQRGVLDTRDVIFFASVIGFALFTTGVIIRNQRAG